MKFNSCFVCIGIALLSILSACTLQKHRYTSGFHIERGGSDASIAFQQKNSKSIAAEELIMENQATELPKTLN